MIFAKDRFCLCITLVLIACGQEERGSGLQSTDLLTGTTPRAISFLGVNDLSRDHLIELTPEEYEFSQQSFANSVVTHPRFAPESEAITTQLHSWTHSLHDLLWTSLKNQGKVLDFPKPNIVVKKSDELGARLTWVSACINVPFSFAAESSPPEEIRGKALEIDLPNRTLRTAFTDRTYSDASLNSGGGNGRCVERSPKDPHTRRILERFLSRIENCQLVFEDQGARLSPGCSPDLASKNYRGEQIQISLPSNWIQVESSLLTHLSPEQMIGVLMHELAHYYLMSTDQDVYNVFYDLDAKPRGVRPAEWKVKSPIIDKIRDAKTASLSDWNDEPKRNRYLRAIEEGDRHYIGWYTNEEEADDIGLEWLTMLGINPLEMPRALLRLMSAKEKNPDHSTPIFPPIADLDAKTCQGLLDRGFRSERGERIQVSIGDYDEPHHNLCFRVANLKRQIDMYGYHEMPRPESLTLMSETEWKAALHSLRGTL